MYFWNNRDNYSFSLNKLYCAADITKQGFAKQRKRSFIIREQELYVIEIVQQVRKDHPTLSCRAIYFKMNPYMIGRDKFERICRRLGFTVSKPINYRRTTDSTGVIRFPNLTINRCLDGINQIWSSDITYFEIDQVFYYITFIMDNYSRRILGHYVSSRLFTQQTTIPALKKAIKTRGAQMITEIIFHSDGGGQYYSDAFLDLTSRYGFKNSMCEFAWENPKAERINGVIKNNYLKHWNIKTLPELVKQVDRAVKLYNYDKPHSSLGRMSPVEFEKSLFNLDKHKPTKKQIEPIME